MANPANNGSMVFLGENVENGGDPPEIAETGADDSEDNEDGTIVAADIAEDAATVAVVVAAGATDTISAAVEGFVSCRSVTRWSLISRFTAPSKKSEGSNRTMFSWVSL